MTFTLNINVDNDAFTPEPYAETARLLREIADRLDGVLPAPPRSREYPGRPSATTPTRAEDGRGTSRRSSTPTGTTWAGMRSSRNSEIPVYQSKLPAAERGRSCVG